MRTIVKRSIWVLAVLAPVPFILIAAHFYGHQAGERKLVALLNGDDTVNILRIETKYQQRRLICTDKDVLRYIKAMLLNHPKQMTNAGGFSYYGYITFTGGGRFDGYMSVGNNGFDVSISSQAAEEGFMTHSVLLVPPVPERVRQVFQFLSDSHPKVAGTVLILKEGGNVERQYDASLVAR
jgi:hypothetical protein